VNALNVNDTVFSSRRKRFGEKARRKILAVLGCKVGHTPSFSR
jgi:hypothetical protein